MCGFSTRIVSLLLLASSVTAVGCSRPYGDGDGDERLRMAMEAAIAREVGEIPPDSEFETVPNAPSEIEETLAPRRAELDELGPAPARGGLPIDLGEDLYGAPQQQVFISLETAIGSAIENNLSAQGARLTQGISATEIAQAEAAFDAVFFSNFDFARLEQPRIVAEVSGTPLSPAIQDTKQWSVDTGLQSQLTSGGSVKLSTRIGYDDIADSSGITYNPDPAWSTAVALGITQPLLRGFGSDVALAQLRFSENATRVSSENLRAQLLQIVYRVEAAYWQLVLSRQNLVATKWLLDVGVSIRDILDKRREIDVTAANYADAVATVERRRGDLTVAQRDARYASDALKALMNDPEFPLGEETLIAPADWMTDEPIRYNLREAIAIGIDRAPSVRRSLLSIDDASIGVTLADNGRLPQLDLEGQMRWNGLDQGLGSSYDNMVDTGLVDYLLGIRFSQPLGNKAAEAVYRRARLQRSAAVVGYQQSIQQVVLQIKNALRDVRANATLIGQSRALRLAQAENLRALQASEQTMGQLTPEFLSLKFQRQDGLAAAQVREVQALVDYNVSIARLFEAMGIGLRMNQIELVEVDSGDGSVR